MKTYGFNNVEFFMDTSYFAHDWKKKYGESERKYIVINLNKNAEKFLPEIIQDVKKLYNQ
jgi:hypothetical protein